MSTLAATDGTEGEWVDVRMTDPDQGEWELDAVVVDGRTEHVELRVRADLVESFVTCLTEDLPKSRIRDIRAKLGAAAGMDDDESADTSDEGDASASQD
ncbi:hypothetical protein [Halorientalis halophila]|uniref:hypothetical protein n=1 Tax=Halorientalis halophila TaxID=3108499 RepID=UPI00300A0F1B